MARNLGALAGRFMLSLIFVSSGLQKLAFPDLYIGAMSKASIPIAAELAYVAAAIEVLGGFAILIGLQARAAAVVLFFYLVPVTIVFHVIPRIPVEVLKNLSIMGGLLILATQGGGGFSLENVFTADSAADDDAQGGPES